MGLLLCSSRGLSGVSTAPRFLKTEDLKSCGPGVESRTFFLVLSTVIWSGTDISNDRNFHSVIMTDLQLFLNIMYKIRHTSCPKTGSSHKVPPLPAQVTAENSRKIQALVLHVVPVEGLNSLYEEASLC